MGSVHSIDERALRGKGVLGVDDVVRSLTRIAFEIIERNGDTEELATARTPTHGVFLAKRLVEGISKVGGLIVEYAIIDLTMFRDDLADKPLHTPKPTFIPPAGIDGRTMILVDDVLHAGRTIKATLDAFSGIGRPSRVQLTVLVDCGHRELPIRLDYVGKNLPTSRQKTVTTLPKESDGHDGVLLGKEN